MEKKWVKFLKEYEEYKVDAIVELETKDAESLVNLKIAEETDAPESKTLDNVLEEFGKNFEEKVTGITEDVTTKLVENLSKSVKKRIPAVAKDLKEKNGGFDPETGEFWNAVYLSSGKNPKLFDKRLTAVNDEFETKADPTGLGTHDEVEGGFLVPEITAAEIWDIVMSDDNFISRTDQRRTSSNNLRINGFDRRGFAANQFAAGVQAYWMDEADEYTASQPDFVRKRLELSKLGVLIYVTDEELEDANTALAPRLNGLAAQAIGFKTNEALLAGTGAGQPLGALHSSNSALVVVSKEDGQSNNTILHKNINKMYHRMAPNLRNGAVWVVHPDLEELLEFISFNDVSGTTQVPVYLPAGGLTDRPFGTLRGRPVIPSQHAQSLGQRGDISFINWSQVASLRKAGAGAGIRTAQSMHVRFLFDEMAFKFTFRVDAQPMWHTALTDKHGTTTRSPYVVLDYRTDDSSSGL